MIGPQLGASPFAASSNSTQRQGSSRSTRGSASTTGRVSFGTVEVKMIDGPPGSVITVDAHEMDLANLFFEAIDHNGGNQISKQSFLQQARQCPQAIKNFNALIADFEKYFPDSNCIGQYQTEAIKIIMREGNPTEALTELCQRIHTDLNNQLSENTQIIERCQKKILEKFKGNKTLEPASNNDFADFYKMIFTPDFLNQLSKQRAQKHRARSIHDILIKRLEGWPEGAKNVVSNTLRGTATSDEHPSQHPFLALPQAQRGHLDINNDAASLGIELRRIMQSSRPYFNEAMPSRETPSKHTPDQIIQHQRTFEDRDIEQIRAQLQNKQLSFDNLVTIIECLVTIQHIEIDDNGQLRLTLKHIRDGLQKLNADLIRELNTLEKCLNQPKPDKTQVKSLIETLCAQIDQEWKKYNNPAEGNPFNYFFTQLPSLIKAIKISNQYMEKKLKPELNRAFDDLDKLTKDTEFDPVTCFKALEFLIKHGIHFSNEERTKIDTHIENFKQWMTDKAPSLNDPNDIVDLLEKIPEMLTVQWHFSNDEWRSVDELLFDGVLLDTKNTLIARLFEALDNLTDDNREFDPVTCFKALEFLIKHSIHFSDEEKTKINTHIENFKQWMTDKAPSLNDPAIINALLADISEMLTVQWRLSNGQMSSVDELRFDGVLRKTKEKLEEKINQYFLGIRTELDAHSPNGQSPNPKLFFQALREAIPLDGWPKSEKEKISGYIKGWIPQQTHSPPTEKDQITALIHDLEEMVMTRAEVSGQDINLDQARFEEQLNRLLSQIRPPKISL